MIYNIYLCCLAIGVIYTLITTVISGLVSAVDLDLDLDFDLEMHFDLHLPIRPFTVMVFITVFGGSGLILCQFLLDLITVPIALFLAYIVSKFMYEAVYLRLVRAQTRTKSARDAIGVVATVLETIPPTGFGRISYIVDKNILSAAAKSQDLNSNGFKKNSKVIIKDIIDNIYYVSESDTERKLEEASSNHN